ncbi:hypothetical protein RR11_1835 [Ruegeria sp. R11]|nr:hypothetical protein RR11_1835 [Ruegeria sp. R11]
MCEGPDWCQQKDQTLSISSRSAGYKAGGRDGADLAFACW